MTSATAILFALLGVAPRDDCEKAEGLCWLCASPLTRGQPVDQWNGASFTGQNRVRCPNATHVCEPCVWIASRLSPVPGRPPKPGKKLGGNWRNYSHLYEDNWHAPALPDGERVRGYTNASKGEKPLIRAFLASEHLAPWFAAIADSGQKHVLPWAPLNGPGRAGVVLFDEQLVRVPDDQSLVAELMALLTAGCTKDELSTGDYTPRAWQLCGADALLAFEERRGGERGGAWWSLALWLAQRDEETVQRRLAAEKEAKRARGSKRKAPKPDGRTAARATRGVSRDTTGERAQTLGPAAHATARRGADLRNPGGAGDEHAAPVADRKPGQGVLPGIG